MVEGYLNRVARRLPDHSFLVAGPQYPDDIDWADNVRLVSHLPPARHPAFYSSAKWQLNATRADMVAAGWSPSVRLFEAGAVGAPVISDYWEGIDVLFAPGKEILIPRTTEEVAEILATWHEDDRRAMGEAFRARVLAEHTAERRAQELERYVAVGTPLSAA